MHNEELQLIGSMEAVLTKADGSVEVTRKDNIIVNGGFDLICDALGKTASRPAAVGWIAVGTGAVAPAVTDTLLGAEIARVASTYAHTASTKVFTHAATLSAGTGTGAITEAGVFNVVTANTGTMLDRVTFSVINKGALDTLTITFTFTLT